MNRFMLPKVRPVRGRDQHEVETGVSHRAAPSLLSFWRVFLVGVVLFGLVFVLFLPATRNAFVNYDDPEYVTENPYVQSGLTWTNLKWALTSGHAANWHPLTWWSHMLDYRFYGLDPGGHHLTNVLLHALNAALLFLVLQRMTGALGRSLAVAVLFGIHPLRVESVAWVAERKDVLSGSFFLLTLWCYANYVRAAAAAVLDRGTNIPPPRLDGGAVVSPSAGGELRQAVRRAALLWYAAAWVALALGLMSKPMLVTVPFVLLLLDWWPLRRGVGLSTFASLLREKVPFFLLVAASSVVTFKVQQSGSAVADIVPLISRVENALVSYGRYLEKIFRPVDLAVYYPHESSWPLAGVLACGAVLTTISILAVLLARRLPYFPVGWFWYLGTLVPVIGLVQVGTQSMADRYTYLPTIGIFVMVVWGLHEAVARRREWKIALVAAGAAAVLACATLTYRQIGTWKDSETLFRQALAVTRENSVALDNYARALGEKGRLDESMEHYRAALRLNPSDPFAHNGLGVLWMKKRRYDDAARHLRQALRLDPNNAVAHYNLGIILGRRGSLEEAIRHFEDAVRLQPHYAEAHNNLGGALAMQKRFDDAIPHYREAIRLKPGHAIIHKNLGVALVEKGRLDEAIEELREAVRLQPNFSEARDKLRTALELHGGPPSAVEPSAVP